MSYTRKDSPSSESFFNKHIGRIQVGETWFNEIEERVKILQSKFVVPKVFHITLYSCSQYGTVSEPREGHTQVKDMFQNELID